MGLKKLLTDLSDGKQNEFTQGIDFKQRSMPWPDSYEEGKPLLTRRNFDEKAFEDLDTGSVGYGSEAGGGGRLLDSGVLNAGLGEMKSYLDLVKDNNYSRDNRQGLTTASKSLVQRVPVGVDSDGLSIDQDGKNYSDY